MTNIVIVDYGVGNLFSLSSSLNYLGLSSQVTKDKNILKQASHIILPGVGAFGDAVLKLEKTGLIPVLKQCVNEKKPLLGICLGMQLLFEKSFEHGENNGLGFIKGEVHALKDDLLQNGYGYKVPHMGWNNLNISKEKNKIMLNSKQLDSVYFVHSFYAKKCENSIVATANYGVDIPAVVNNDNVYGCQFHPEKSGEKGLEILKAFAKI